jgi:hypothetical protein
LKRAALSIKLMFLSKNHQMSATQMTLSHPIKLQDKHDIYFNSMTDFLKNINTVRQRHSSFEQAEKPSRP